MCVCVCIYIYTYMYIHAYIYACRHTCILDAVARPGTPAGYTMPRRRGRQGRRDGTPGTTRTPGTSLLMSAALWARFMLEVAGAPA